MKSTKPRSGGSVASTKPRMASRRRRARSAIATALAATTSEACRSGVSAAIVALPIAGLDSLAAWRRWPGACRDATMVARAEVILILLKSHRGGAQLETCGIGLRILAVPDHAVDELCRAHRLLGHRRLDRSRRLLVELDLIYLLCDREVVGILLEKSPAAMLREEPHAVREVGEVDGALVVELHVIRIVPGPTDSVVVLALEPLIDDLDRTVHVGLVGDDARDLLSIAHRVDEARCFQHGGDHRPRRVRVLLYEFRARAENLFRMVLPDVLRRDRGESDLVEDRPVVPRLADAESVHIAHPHVRHHLRRWNHNRFDVVQRVNAVRRQPVVDPHRMRAGGKGLREDVFALLAVDQLL